MQIRGDRTNLRHDVVSSICCAASRMLPDTTNSWHYETLQPRCILEYTVKYTLPPSQEACIVGENWHQICQSFLSPNGIEQLYVIYIRQL